MLRVLFIERLYEKSMFKVIKYIVCGLFFPVVMSCSSGEPANQSMSIYLCDSPADYEEVIVDIQSVQVAVDQGAWKALAMTSESQISMLELTNGVSLKIAGGQFDPTGYTRLKLTFGKKNSITVDGKTHVMSIAEADMEREITISKGVEGDYPYTVLLDLDILNSVVAESADTYTFVPHVSTVDVVGTSGVKGVVMGANSLTNERQLIELTAANGTKISTYSNISTGYFFFRAMPDTYSMKVIGATKSKYNDTIINDIVVLKDEIYNFKSLKISQKPTSE